MTGREAPAAALFHKRIGKLNNDVDRLTLGITFYLRFARHDRSVIAVNPHLHIRNFRKYRNGLCHSWRLRYHRPPC